MSLRDRMLGGSLAQIDERARESRAGRSYAVASALEWAANLLRGDLGLPVVDYTGDESEPVKRSVHRVESTTSVESSGETDG